MTTVGVIGLGRIGLGVARNIAKSGFTLSVCDIRPDVTAEFGEDAVAADPAVLGGRSDVVIVAVVDDAQAREVLTGPTGALTTARPGSTVVIVSTLQLGTILEIAAAGRDKGVDVLDAGVTGGNGAALRGTLVTMVGGDEVTIDRVRPVLEAFSSLLVHVGPLGYGMRAKLARNLVVYSEWMVRYSSQLLAEAAGVDLSKLRQIIAASEAEMAGAPAWLTREQLGPVAYDPDTLRMRQATAGLAHKDLKAIADLAATLGVELPVVELADSYVERVLGMSDTA